MSFSFFINYRNRCSFISNDFFGNATGVLSLELTKKEIMEFSFTDGKEHEVAIYFLDWDRKDRWSIVDILDANSQKVLHSYNLTDFAQGIYLRYKMKGNLQCRLTNVWTRRVQKSPDVGFSAIFFDTGRR